MKISSDMVQNLPNQIYPGVAFFIFHFTKINFAKSNFGFSYITLVGILEDGNLFQEAQTHKLGRVVSVTDIAEI